MRLALIRPLISCAARGIVSRTGTALLFGIVAGCFVLAWCHQLTAVLGLSLTTVTAVAVCLALGFELAWRQPRTQQPGREISLGAFALVCLVPAAWTVGFEWLMQVANGVIGRFTVESLAAPVPRMLLTLGIAFVALCPPIYALTRLPLYLMHLWNIRADENSSAHNGLAILVPFLFGMAAGIIAAVLVIAPYIGLNAVSFAAVVGLFGLFLLAWKHSSTLVTPDHPLVSAPRSRFSAALASVGTSSLVLCLGTSTAVAMRMTHQLLPTAGYLVWTEWAGLLAAVALGIYFSSRSVHTDQKPHSLRNPAFTIALLLAAGWCALLPVLFSWHVSGLLHVNSYVSQVWLQLALKSFVALSMVAPFGFAWGMIAASCRADDSNTDRIPQLSLFSFVAGLLAARWMLLPRWPIENMLPVIAISLTTAACVGLLATRTLPRRRLTRAGLAGLLCLIALSPLSRQQYNPARAARLLFSTQVFLAKRDGMQGQLLPYLDEGRLVARREGEHGTYTLWKMRGQQLQLREGGIPKAIVSTDSRICPQFSADVMQAALPIVLHQQPRRTLLLGLQGGITLDTCFHFPMEEVVCAESDPQLIRLVKEDILTRDKQDLFESRRVKIFTIDPALALAANNIPYDVIISCPNQPALAHSTAYFTLEFYSNAANRLADDGIFCQKFQYADFGPEPLRVVAATMQQAFRTVAAIETASGEFALLGTNSPKGLRRDGLVARLQAHHVRNLLGQVGWDWVMPLNLSAYGATALQKVASEGGADCNTAANGIFAWRLPPEVMRWGAKQQEIHNVLASLTGSLLKWSAKDDAPIDVTRSNPVFEMPGTHTNDQRDHRDVLLRLEEIAGRRNIIARFPDQRWAYRKELRERMKTKSRSIIEHVKGDGPVRKLHPEDKRRQAYLRALGNAVKKPSSETIGRIAEFAHPYDPLVSFFVHDEIARLYDRTKLSNPADELRHRLHLVYYSDPHDRSVRNIIAAINLLANHPKAMSNAIDRRDHIDGLLQMLQFRWRARRGDSSISKNVALNDAAESVAAMTNAFEAIEKIYADSNLNADEWKARHRVLKRELLGPLRSYRTHLLAQSRAPKRRPSDKSTNAN